MDNQTPTSQQNKESVARIILDPSSPAHWKIIDKFDWRLFLPIGLLILAYCGITGIHPAAFLARIGEFCTALGAVNLGGRLMFKDHISGDPSLPEPVRQKNRHVTLFLLGTFIILFIAIMAIVRLHIFGS